MKIRRSSGRLYAELVRNYVVDVAAVPLRSRRFLPLMTNFYLTKRCNLRCRYCYPPGSEPELALEDVLVLLEKIRPRNPSLNITGGEPLMYPEVGAVLRRAAELKFRPLLLSTNGLMIERVVEELDRIDHVVISLDSLTREVNEAMTGVAGSTEKIVHSIRRCADLSVEKGFQLSVHTVIAPETIDGVEDVLKFCESVGASLSVSPEHGRYRPCSDLVGDDGYRTLIDRLTELKGQGKPVFCSKGYLQTIRDFTPHCCFPFVSPRVEPDGRVYFPCQRIKDRHVYLQDYPNLYQLMQREAEWIEEPECSSRCYLACYVEVERYLRNPLSALKELPMRRTVADQRTEARRSSPEPDSRGV